MKLFNIPFFLIALSSLVLPYTAAALNSKFVTYIPEALLLGIYLVYMVARPENALSFSKRELLILIIAIIHTIASLGIGMGIGSGGVLILILTTILYVKLLEFGEVELRDVFYLRQVRFIYIIHAIFILFELIIVVSGNVDLFKNIAGAATEVTKYKDYNSATFLWFLGINDVYGMNSLLLGSQTASQLVLFSMLIFLPVLGEKYYGANKRFILFWFVFSVFLFPFVATMTAVVVLLVLVFFLVYLVPNSLFRDKRLWILVPLAIITFFEPLFSFLAFRISDPEHINIYLEAFMAAPTFFSQLPFSDMLIGLGEKVRDIPNIGADFGLFMLLIQIGLVFFVAVSMCVLHIIFSVLIKTKHISKLKKMDAWIYLGVVNALLALGWAISLVHYTPALELGGRQLFAFHLAICIVYVNKIYPLQVIFIKNH